MASPTPETESLATRIREAEAQAESNLVKYIMAKSEDDPDVALKFLSRRWPERWRERKETVNTENTWQLQALEMIKAGTLTLEDIEESMGAELASEVRLLLAPPDPSTRGNPDKGIVIEGEFSNKPESNHAE